MEIYNKKAKYDYFIEDEYEAGIVLTGTEIKSVRNGSCNIKDCYGIIKNNEIFLLNMFINHYKEGNIFNHEETRSRKLLLHKKEIKKIAEKPRYIEARRVGPFNPNFRGDSIVLDLMIHDIDIIINLVNSEVKAIQAMGSPVYTELADLASVNLAFANGSVAHIFVSRISQTKERIMSIHGDKSLIQLDFTTQDINIYRSGQTQQVLGDGEMRYRNEFVQERLFVYKDNPLKLEISHFINCVIGKVARVVTVEHDLRSLKVALQTDELVKSSLYGCREINI